MMTNIDAMTWMAMEMEMGMGTGMGTGMAKSLNVGMVLRGVVAACFNSLF